MAPVDSVRCETCPNGCALAPGALGACHARGNVDGRVIATGYGHVTALAVDPVEKKPLARWMPGHTVLSLGGYGCNLHCPWCQNHQISQVGKEDVGWHTMAPVDVVALAKHLNENDPRMAGVAYTYNEPLVAWEFVRDCAQLVRDVGLANVLVSAGCVSPGVMEEVAPLIDAANVDLKSLRATTYQRIGGDVSTVMETIRLLAATPGCHLEVTTLVVPDVNDTPEEMEQIANWLASVDEDITLHVTRFHPAWRMRDRRATPVPHVYALADVARRHLPHVYTGNC